MLSYVLEQIFNGLCQGGIYALMAIGYSMIAGVTGLVTFTYGEVIMIGAFASYYCYTLLGGSVWLGILSAFVCSGLLGILIYKVCYEHFLNAPSYICLVCTIGFSMIIKSWRRYSSAVKRRACLRYLKRNSTIWVLCASQIFNC
mgnify:CR=1 FL=1